MTRPEKGFGERSNDDIIREILREHASRENPIGRKEIIKQAKEEIKHTVTAYLKKDDEGRYKIPLIRQRPVLLMGPPGIGKTQIMEQIAEECKIGLVAYTITHHTRQSAVGLPLSKKWNLQAKSIP